MIETSGVTPPRVVMTARIQIILRASYCGTQMVSRTTWLTHSPRVQLAPPTRLRSHSRSSRPTRSELQEVRVYETFELVHPGRHRLAHVEVDGEVSIPVPRHRSGFVGSPGHRSSAQAVLTTSPIAILAQADRVELNDLCLLQGQRFANVSWR